MEGVVARSGRERAALQQAAAASLRPIAGGLTLLYLAFVPADLVFLPPGAAETMAAVAAGMGLATLAVFLVLGRRPVPARSASAAAGLTALVVLATVLLQLRLTGNPEDTIFVALLVVGAGAFLLSAAWFGALASAAALGWLAIAAGEPLQAWRHYGLVLGVAVLIGGLLLILRRGSILALERERRRFSALLDEGDDLITILGPDGRIRYQSPSVERVLGWDPDRLLGTSAFELVHPEDHDALRDALSGEVPRARLIELRVRRRDGDRRVVEVRPNDLRDDPAVRGIVLTSRDVTERRAAEDALLQAERRYRTLVESLPAVTYMDVVDPDSDSVYVSPQVRDLLGCEPEKWLREPEYWRDHLHPDDEARVWKAWRRGIAEDGRFEGEYRMVREDGETVWVSERSVALPNEAGEPWFLQGVLVDVTERKRAEEAAEDARKLFESLAEHAPTGIFLTDDLGGRLWVNDRWSEITGLPKDRAMGLGWADTLHPEDRDRILQGWARATAGTEEFAAEYRVCRPDGETRWVFVRATPRSDESGRPSGYLGTVTDVTELKHAEEERERVLHRFESLAEQAPVGIFLADADGECRWVNDGWCAIAGLSRDGAAGRGWQAALHPKDADRVATAWTRAAAEGRAFEAEYRYRRPTGEVRWVATRARPLTEGEPGEVSGWLGVVSDITEQKLIEETLRRSENELQRSLEVLRRTDEDRRRLLAYVLSSQEEERGRMAEGIEDDSLQHLAAVGLRLGALRGRVEDPEGVGALDRMGSSVQEAAGRLRQLLVELRPRTLEQDGLAAALRQSLEVAAAGAGFEFSIEDRQTAEAPMAARTTAYRIALDAIENVRRHAAARKAEILLDPRDEGLFVRITDDGVGFDLESTRASLGLVAMRERAELAGGWLRVRSTPGAGTTIGFWLPEG